MKLSYREVLDTSDVTSLYPLSIIISTCTCLANLRYTELPIFFYCSIINQNPFEKLPENPQNFATIFCLLQPENVYVYRKKINLSNVHEKFYPGQNMSDCFANASVLINDKDYLHILDIYDTWAARLYA